MSKEYLSFIDNAEQGKDYNEIAKTLNISVRTAKRYKSQVIDVLQKELKVYLLLVAMIDPCMFN